MGLYTLTILGGNFYLSWFYDRGAIKDPGTIKGLSQAINRGLIRKFLPKYANVYVTIQSHGLSASAWTHYVTANGVRNGLVWVVPTMPLRAPWWRDGQSGRAARPRPPARVAAPAAGTQLYQPTTSPTTSCSCTR